MRRRFSAVVPPSDAQSMAQETSKTWTFYGLILMRRPLGYGQIGAGDGIRTHDPNLGKVVLYP